MDDHANRDGLTEINDFIEELGLTDEVVAPDDDEQQKLDSIAAERLSRNPDAMKILDDAIADIDNAVQIDV